MLLHDQCSDRLRCFRPSYLMCDVWAFVCRIGILDITSGSLEIYRIPSCPLNLKSMVMAHFLNHCSTTSHPIDSAPTVPSFSMSGLCCIALFRTSPSHFYHEIGEKFHALARVFYCYADGLW